MTKPHEVRLYWMPSGGDERKGGHDRERVAGVQRVETREFTHELDDGELILYKDDGTAVFDRNQLRGFDAGEAVEVPDYAQPDDGDDSGTSEGE